jgi:superfamily II DNA/RNA helicase
LEQYYAVVNLDKKLDALWGFVKSHLKMKGVVFVTSGKQVSHPTCDENVKLMSRSDLYTKLSVDFTLVFPSYIFTGNKNRPPG